MLSEWEKITVTSKYDSREEGGASADGTGVWDLGRLARSSGEWGERG